MRCLEIATGAQWINQINQTWCEDERGAFPCPSSECGGLQHHPQLQFVGFPVRHSTGDKEGLPVVNDRKQAQFLLLAKIPKFK